MLQELDHQNKYTHAEGLWFLQVQVAYLSFHNFYFFDQTSYTYNLLPAQQSEITKNI
jgi:hypothetical protein